MMIAVPFLALGAGRVLAGLARRGVGARVLACALLAIPLVQSARLDMLLAREDTRSVASRDLLAVIGANDLAAVDGLGSQYGPPLVPRGETLQLMMSDQAARAVGPEQQGMIWLSRSEQRLIDELEAGLPPSPNARHLLAPQRYWKYISYYPTDFLFPGEEEAFSLDRWMDQWGVDVYVRVDRTPEAEPRAPVDEFTVQHGVLVYELSPTRQTAPREAALPTDMDFALTQLWTYERPGPWIRAWRLDSGRAAIRQGSPTRACPMTGAEAPENVPRKPKVLVLTHSLSEVDGVGVYSVSMLRFLAPHCAGIDVYIGRKHRGFASEMPTEGVAIHPVLPMNHFPFLSLPKLALLLITSLPMLVRACTSGRHRAQLFRLPDGFRCRAHGGAGRTPCCRKRARNVLRDSCGHASSSKSAELDVPSRGPLSHGGEICITAGETSRESG